jgi:uncharacterized protein (TIGR02284 family)
MHVAEQHDTSKLDDLIVTTIDSARGYENAAKHAGASRYADYFREVGAERRKVIDELSAESRALGGTPAEYGSAAATLHRRWEDLRTALGGGDKAILAEIERGEDYLMEEWRRVLEDERMSVDALAVVRPCFASIRRGHDRAKQLREELQAAD